MEVTESLEHYLIVTAQEQQSNSEVVLNIFSLPGPILSTLLLQ